MNGPAVSVTSSTKKGWRLANQKGFLHAINRKGEFWRIGNIFKRNFVRVSSIPGCHFYNKECIRLSCKKVPTKDSYTLFVSLLRTKPFSSDVPEVVFECFLQEGEFCEIVEHENGFKQAFVKDLADIYVDEKIPVKGQFYQIMAPKWIRDETKHDPHQALVLFNDGRHLYAVCGEEKKFLSFQKYQKENSSDSNVWMKFLEKEVTFKTLGHTLNGSAIVSLREKQNRWSVVISIKKGQTATVDELVSAIGVYFSK